MFTQITTVEEFKAIFIEMMLNKTNVVSKVTEGSAVNAMAFGNAKNAQKNNKDVALLESYMFPDVATGSKLDGVSRLNGFSQRFGAKKSSTYLLLVANAGTQYLQDTVTFKSVNGIEFELETDITVGPIGWTYAKIRSLTTGSIACAEALSINQVTPQPVGHQYCVNEYEAQYGTDFEIDDVFRKRVKQGADVMSRGTIGAIEQSLMKINDNVLRVYYAGLDVQGRLILSVLSQNGIDFLDSEFNDMLIRAEKYFTLSEMRPLGYRGFGVTLQNVQWQPIDVSFRVKLEPNAVSDLVRKDIQIKMNKYLDYRYFDLTTNATVNWTDLLDIVKNTDNVRYVMDAFFYPLADVKIDVYKLPRIRGFRMLDENGNLISDTQGILNPVYYPNQIDFSYLTTALQNI